MFSFLHYNNLTIIILIDLRPNQSYRCLPVISVLHIPWVWKLEYHIDLYLFCWFNWLSPFANFYNSIFSFPLFFIWFFLLWWYDLWTLDVASGEWIEFSSCTGVGKSSDLHMNHLFSYTPCWLWCEWILREFDIALICIM